MASGTSTAAAVKLRITEIFASVQGESTRVGLPTVFVRLTGCPLRCTWCDTAYAFTGGESRTLDEVMAEVARHGLEHVCVSGGEPLSQKACLALLSALCDAGYSVSLETSGALDVGAVDPRVSRVVDLKAPGSGEVERNLYANIALLTPHDEIKIVLAGEADYEWAKRQIAQHRIAERCTVLLSPVAGALDPARLAEWVVRDRLPVRFQLQLHKVLWNDARGR
ncbi:7-carboxy-7-deazaguanine synthase QueE [Thauera linaloolentis]|uniref:7-carboxy-7-deazaguanine synthase n=1 Tax=Thauera linaloolentis (strain DSM 12138 / JCM 21573 / CCUG 41526 / CIP 105981 / IAM 15112 / NBRC 102519 / 47Lol) TaxID=1123367 RepID=N6ZBU2_THAL4|nr:7-carboxy-7-deazaguanine synthase QueE [Thauera linaloolentis]ENO89664.1 radical SAM protein [Thauera linaloolentis 47Lol = DSM 12138]MCM8567144.1 7-carboxy-7-deazaguanine synthase QueE [Thauera linaloolentis]